MAVVLQKLAEKIGKSDMKLNAIKPSPAGIFASSAKVYNELDPFLSF